MTERHSNALNALQVALAHCVTAEARIDQPSEVRVVDAQIDAAGQYQNRTMAKVRDPQADEMLAALRTAIDALMPFAAGGIRPAPGSHKIAEAKIVISTSITGRTV